MMATVGAVLVLLGLVVLGLVDGPRRAVMRLAHVDGRNEAGEAAGAGPAEWDVYLERARRSMSAVKSIGRRALSRAAHDARWLAGR